MTFIFSGSVWKLCVWGSEEVRISSIPVANHVLAIALAMIKSYRPTQKYRFSCCGWAWTAVLAYSYAVHRIHVWPVAKVKQNTHWNMCNRYMTVRSREEASLLWVTDFALDICGWTISAPAPSVRETNFPWRTLLNVVWETEHCKKPWRFPMNEWPHIIPHEDREVINAFGNTS